LIQKKKRKKLLESKKSPFRKAVALAKKIEKIHAPNHAHHHAKHVHKHHHHSHSSPSHHAKKAHSSPKKSAAKKPAKKQDKKKSKEQKRRRRIQMKEDRKDRRSARRARRIRRKAARRKARKLAKRGRKSHPRSHRKHRRSRRSRRSRKQRRARKRQQQSEHHRFHHHMEGGYGAHNVDFDAHKFHNPLPEVLRTEFVEPYAKRSDPGCPGCKYLHIKKKWPISYDPSSVAVQDLPFIESLHKRVNYLIEPVQKYITINQRELDSATQQVEDAAAHHQRIADFHDKHKRKLLIPKYIQDDQKIVDLNDE